MKETDSPEIVGGGGVDLLFGSLDLNLGFQPLPFYLSPDPCRPGCVYSTHGLGGNLATGCIYSSCGTPSPPSLKSLSSHQVFEVKQPDGAGHTFK